MVVESYRNSSILSKITFSFASLRRRIALINLMNLRRRSNYALCAIEEVYYSSKKYAIFGGQNRRKTKFNASLWEND